jgi:hypothetical protein
MRVSTPIEQPGSKPDRPVGSFLTDPAARMDRP